jgi:hypothetical protein
MTQQARTVLAACELALKELEMEQPLELWQLRWFTVVALLRCVGHALAKVDHVSGNTSMKTAIDDAWSRWQADRAAHAIFWDFIEEERNRALKEFTFGAGRGVVIEPPTARFEIDTQGKWKRTNPNEEGRSWHTYTITKGPFKGQNQRDVVREAIQWWKEQLDQIDREAPSIAPGTT